STRARLERPGTGCSERVAAPVALTCLAGEKTGAAALSSTCAQRYLERAGRKSRASTASAGVPGISPTAPSGRSSTPDGSANAPAVLWILTGQNTGLMKFRG